METQIAVERPPRRFTERPEAAALEYPGWVHVLLLAALAGLQLAWLGALGAAVYWLA